MKIIDVHVIYFKDQHVKQRQYLNPAYSKKLVYEHVVTCI